MRWFYYGRKIIFIILFYFLKFISIIHWGKIIIINKKIWIISIFLLAGFDGFFTFGQRILVGAAEFQQNLGENSLDLGLQKSQQSNFGK